ncbi:Chromate transporter, chromate ion transporter (CHR) family, partial [Dysosmobacter welbionis]
LCRRCGAPRPGCQTPDGYPGAEAGIRAGGGRHVGRAPVSAGGYGHLLCRCRHRSAFESDGAGGPDGRLGRRRQCRQHRGCGERGQRPQPGGAGGHRPDGGRPVLRVPGPEPAGRAGLRPDGVRPVLRRLPSGGTGGEGGSGPLRPVLCAARRGGQPFPHHHSGCPHRRGPGGILLRTRNGGGGDTGP